MTTLIEAARQALEALEAPWDAPYIDCCDLALGKKVKAITALRQAVEQAEQAQPVEWMTFIPLYTAPPVASNDTSQNRVDETAKQRHEQEPVAHRHKWDKSGERCVKCGDKDWMGGSCRVSDASIYTSPPPLQPEPVIDKSAAIRIATALGWTPPRQPLTEQRIQQIWFDNLDGIISFEECVTVIREAEEAHGIGEKK